MSGDRDQEFREFVVAQRAGLLRSTRLLTGDSSSADDLLNAALLKGYRRWDGVAAEERLTSVRRLLLSTFLSPLRTATHSQQVLTDSDRATDEVESLLAALHLLQPATCAVVVLRFYDDLSEAQTAELLECGVGTVRAEAAAATAALAPVLAVPAGVGTVGTAESELRERLARAAEAGDEPGDDLAVADAVIARYMAGRRRRSALVVTAVLVLVGAGAARFFAGGDTPATVSAPALGPATDVAGWADPTRGSLADDRAFLSAIQARPWELEAGTPAVSARTVAFAGDVSGIRWALVVGESEGELRGQWFAGPAGAAPGALQPSGVEYRVLPGLPVGGIRPDATGATLLVVTRPGDDVQVSPAVTVDATGKVRRAFSSVDTRDGIAVIREAGANAAASLRYRVMRNGLLAGVGPSAQTAADAAGVTGSGQVPRRPSVGTPSGSAYAEALGHVLTATGLGPADVAPVLLWTGPVPAPAGATVQGTVLVTTMPSGALVTGTAAGPLPGAADEPDVVCGSVAAPAGTKLEDIVSVAGCEITISGGTQRSFVITAPAGYDLVTLRSSEGRVLSTAPLVAGSGSMIDPGTVATAVLSGPGRAALEIVPADARHDALDVG